MDERTIESEKMDKEWEAQEKRMLEFMDQTDSEQKLMKLYSKFSNFPQNIKKNIIINLITIIALTVIVVMSVVYLDYKHPLLFIVYLAASIFLGWKVFITYFYLKHAHFITFTGKITESYPVGSKISGNKHFVLKIVSDDGKELCFPYYDSQTLHFDQYVTLFINNNAAVDLSQWGPYISQYIEVIPTDEINSRLKLLDETDSTTMKAQDYINR